MRELPTIDAAAKASPAKIHKLWEGLGYYTRVRNLQKATKVIMEKHGGKFSQNFDDVLTLPGIGRYTAGAICSIAFNQAVPVLDGNVIRVLTRIFGIGKNPKEKETNARLWKLAEELVKVAQVSSLPVQTRRLRYVNGNCSALNQSLMELGALVCTPRNPQCQICPAKKLCVAFNENRVEKLPDLGKREIATARRFVAFIVENNGHFLVRQRPAGVVNAHLWEFPNVEVGAPVSRPAARLNAVSRRNLSSGIPQSRALRLGEPRSESVADAAIQIFGFTPAYIKPLCTVKHSITRYRITLDVFRVNLGGTSSTSPHSEKAKLATRVTRPSEGIGIWQTPAQMHELAFTSAHRKVLRVLTAKGGG
jgi:A/G-specific adenine glycosylase